MQLRLTDPDGQQLGLVRVAPDGAVTTAFRPGDVTPGTSHGEALPVPPPVGIVGQDEVPTPYPVPEAPQGLDGVPVATFTGVPVPGPSGESTVPVQQAQAVPGVEQVTPPPIVAGTDVTETRCYGPHENAVHEPGVESGLVGEENKPDRNGRY